MALDKLVDSAKLDASLNYEVSRIKAKTGSSSNLTFDLENEKGFGDAIDAIPAGITPSGTKQISINQNGTITEDVTSYANAEIAVNVPSGGWTTDGIINKTEPNGALVSDATNIRNYAFTGYTGITSVNLPECESIGASAFSNCTGILSFSAPKHTSSYQKNNAFEGCNHCTSFYLPKATIIGTAQFKGCSALPYIVLPKCNTIYNEALMNCTSLQGADFGPATTVFERTGIFKNDSNLKTLILRRTSVVPYKVADAFNGTPFASGGSGGTIYIPESLYNHLGDGTSSDYQSATNWSTLHGYGTITWAKIEGSIYETKYVDGSDIQTY